ncbi:Asp23/Gls24 family envelope stress response protein [Cellulomonas sp. Sa3CUA2]|uniref:Asp23/Gls24 family envelope stress response protein n=1 Tax=Cellulomonas avistercoris TaxID=2762242 RepID=A0ABR8QHM0_9CELL|nr:Asp23/Gls24 family envelope stress response protein [Cellulomonas avistercoris]MBD7919809.1 Asp23/Gls24 family envelope stress response protein [Cellulomonas avistercoris]
MSGDRPADGEPLVVVHEETVVVTTAAPDADPVLPVAPEPAVPAAPPDPAELAAAAALSVPGVAGLYPGAFGEIGTHLPGRRVAGVRTRSTADGTSTDVHVIALLGVDLRELAAAVHRAVRDAVGGDVHVTVEDVVT